MLVDLDKYYTPADVAISALERAELPYSPKTCADSTCGSGRLLDAVNEVFGSVECIGIDQDRSAIARLRRKRPSWHLAVADLLGGEPYLNNFSTKIPRSVDLLFINPPFSQGGRKSVEVVYKKSPLRASVAMAHLLRSLEDLKPKVGAVAVVPESLLYSETDGVARKLISESFSLKLIWELKNCTFSGARVNSSVIRIAPEGGAAKVKSLKNFDVDIEASLIRGSLPVHLSQFENVGFPYIHSTSILWLIAGGGVEDLPKTNSLAKGKVSGWVLLIPRVGKPDIQLLEPIFLATSVQLSDCVLAVSFKNKKQAMIAVGRIKERWVDFSALYRGTGAKYTTTARLESWSIENIGLNLTG